MNAGFFLYYFLNYPEFMRMPVGFGVVDSKVIQPVYPDLSAGMDDIIVFHDNPDMNDISLLIIKKSQVTRLAFFNKAQGFSLRCLLRRIA